MDPSTEGPPLTVVGRAGNRSECAQLYARVCGSWSALRPAALRCGVPRAFAGRRETSDRRVGSPPCDQCAGARHRGSHGSCGTRHRTDQRACSGVGEGAVEVSFDVRGQSHRGLDELGAHRPQGAHDATMSRCVGLAVEARLCVTPNEPARLVGVVSNDPARQSRRRRPHSSPSSISRRLFRPRCSRTLAAVIEIPS